MVCTAHPILFKSRRMRWAGHKTRMGQEMFMQGFGGET